RTRGAGAEREVVAEEIREYLRSRSTVDAVVRHIVWVGGRGGKRHPRWIRISRAVVVFVRTRNCLDWTPEEVCVLGAEAGDDGVGGREVQECEQPRVLVKRVTVRRRGDARDAVPGEVRVFHPPQCSMGLIRRPCYARRPSE